MEELGIVGKKAITKIRTLASGDKRRLESEDFDLDLTYITHRIVGMGFPADTLLEQSYRNHIDEVAAYLDRTHDQHYLIFNLSEKQYDITRFGNKVRYYGWPDHHSPPLELLLKVVQAIDDWLCSHKANIAVVHCKAGLGRTGTAISAYLLYSGMFTDADEAMDFFASMRTASCRGVKVPSQRRYVKYFQQILAGIKRPADFRPPKTLRMKTLAMQPVPDIDLLKGGFCPIIEIVYMDEFSSPLHSRKLGRLYSQKKGDRRIEVAMNMTLCGDVLIRVYHEHDLLIGKTYGQLLFRFAFHTSFIENGQFRVMAGELDGPSHGKLDSNDFPPNFAVTLTFDDPDDTDHLTARQESPPSNPSTTAPLWSPAGTTDLPPTAYVSQTPASASAPTPVPAPTRTATPTAALSPTPTPTPVPSSSTAPTAASGVERPTMPDPRQHPPHYHPSADRQPPRPEPPAYAQPLPACSRSQLSPRRSQALQASNVGHVHSSRPPQSQSQLQLSQPQPQLSQLHSLPLHSAPCLLTEDVPLLHLPLMPQSASLYTLHSLPPSSLPFPMPTPTLTPMPAPMPPLISMPTLSLIPMPMVMPIPIPAPAPTPTPAGLPMVGLDPTVRTSGGGPASPSPAPTPVAVTKPS
jgi:phosphatidylinositol-3,4,5-trisphosphate 3-phosphatase/dual-specificity protein phosphatase PTEN